MNPRWAATGGALILCGGVLLAARAPFWWIGAALVAAGGTFLWPLLRPRASQVVERLELGRRKALKELICLALLTVVAVVAIPEVAGGDRPISKDHTAHYLRSWKTRFDFLPQGTVHGWSHSLFAGYPAGYNYPIGSDLWVTSVHLASLGLLDFSEAYAVAFFLSYLLLGYGVYRLGERFFGRGPGILAGVLYLTDPGIIGLGWDAFEWGVWPQRLAMAFALLALAGLPDVIRHRRLGAVAVFALLMGAALITHPVVLLLQLAALATSLIVWLRWGGGGQPEEAPAGPLEAEPSQRRSHGRPLLRLILANGLGLMIAAFWFVPFVDTSDYADVIGRAGQPMLELGLGLLNLNLFEGTWGLILVLGVIGLLYTLRRGGVQGRFVAWLSLVLFFAGSGPLLLVLNLPDHLPSVRSIQFERVSLLAKPFLFVIAAQMALWLIRQLWESGKRAGRPSVDRTVTVGLLTLMCLPMLTSFGVSYYSRHVGRHVQRLSRRADQDDRKQLIHFLNSHPRVGDLERVAFIGPPDDHSILDLAAQLNLPFYKSGYTPGINFKYLIHSHLPSALEALKTRWVVARDELTNKEYDLVRSFGEYYLYEHSTFTPAPFTLLEGSGPLRATKFSAQEIVLKAGPGAHGRFMVPVSYFPRWRLEKDGRPTEILVKKHATSPFSSGFMSAKLSPGVYRFRFEASALDRAASWLSLTGLALVGLLLLGDLRRGAAALPVRLVERLVPATEAVMGWRWTVPAAATVAGLLLMAMLALGTSPPKMKHGNAPKIAQVKYDFLNNLASATVWRKDEKLPPTRCSWRVDRFSCGDSLHMVLRSRYTSHFSRCIEADLQTSPGLTVTYQDVPAGDGIFSYFVCHRGEGKFTLWVNGEKGPSVSCNKEGRKETIYYRTPSNNTGRYASVSFAITQHGKKTGSQHGKKMGTQHGKKMGRFCFLAQSIIGEPATGASGN